MFKKLLRQDKGDTIVEVLISLAILTLILGGAYYSANQSYRNDLDSQEHSTALTIAQSQVEQLRNLSGTTLSTALADGCIYSGTNSGCYVNSNDTSMMSSACPNVNSPPFCYLVAVTKDSTTDLTLAAGGTVKLTTYKVEVSWDQLSSGNKDYVYLYYRWDTL